MNRPAEFEAPTASVRGLLEKLGEGRLSVRDRLAIPPQEMPAQDVRMGLRVEAVWKDDDELETSLENIKWWRPTGEPDADPSTYEGQM